MKLADPLPQSIKTRVKWPEYSPKNLKFIQCNKTDHILADGELIARRLRIIYTPGHDTECVSFYDEETKSLFTGDSVQERDAVGKHDAAGVAFYNDLPSYVHTFETLEKINAENIFAAHDFKPYGFSAKGRKMFRRFLM